MAGSRETSTQSCPYVGIADDPASHYAFPEGAHRCFAMAKPRALDLSYQASYCLSSNHTACRRYIEAQARERAARRREVGRGGRRGAAVLGALARAMVVVVIAVVVLIGVSLGRAMIDDSARAGPSSPPSTTAPAVAP